MSVIQPTAPSADPSSPQPVDPQPVLQQNHAIPGSPPGTIYGHELPEEVKKRQELLQGEDLEATKPGGASDDPKAPSVTPTTPAAPAPPPAPALAVPAAAPATPSTAPKAK